MSHKRKRHADHEEHENHERWLITYADMITLLLALFIVLYALSDTNIRKFTAFAQSVSAAFNTDVFQGSSAFTVTSGQATAPDVGQFDAGQGVVAADFRTVSAALRDYVIGQGIDQQVAVERVADGIAIRISDSLLFESGRARLGDGSLDVLDRVAHVLVGLPNDIRVEGHTDDLPPEGPFYSDNWELSTARALAVLDGLNEAGLDPSRLSAAGYGEYRPLEPNIDDASRARNRRVDILILYTASPDATAEPADGGVVGDGGFDPIPGPAADPIH